MLGKCQRSGVIWNRNKWVWNDFDDRVSDDSLLRILASRCTLHGYNGLSFSVCVFYLGGGGMVVVSLSEWTNVIEQKSLQFRSHLMGI